MIKTINKNNIKRFFEETQQISISCNDKLLVEEVNLSIDTMDKGLIPISTFYRITKGIFTWLFKSMDECGKFYLNLLDQQ